MKKPVTIGSSCLETGLLQPAAVDYKELLLILQDQPPSSLWQKRKCKLLSRVFHKFMWFKLFIKGEKKKRQDIGQKNLYLPSHTSKRKPTAITLQCHENHRIHICTWPRIGFAARTTGTSIVAYTLTVPTQRTNNWCLSCCSAPSACSYMHSWSTNSNQTNFFLLHYLEFVSFRLLHFLYWSQFLSELH